MEFKNKTIELMIKTAINAVGIDAKTLLENIQSFQQWVANAVGHHDRRLQALEIELKNSNQKLDLLLNHFNIKEVDHDGYHEAFRHIRIANGADESIERKD